MTAYKQSKTVRMLAQLEGPLVYALAGITALVSLLVYGTTLIRGGSGLLDMLQPVFGVPYAMLVGAILISLLVINKRWKMLVVIALAQVIHILVLVSPTATRLFSWSEFLNSSVTIACLLTAACIYYQLVEE